MLKQLPEEEFGPGIDIREYSLLDNPSLPSEVNYMSFSCEIVIFPFFLVSYSGNLCWVSWIQVKKSWLDVQLCKEGAQDCFASNNATVGGILKFPRHSNEETVLKNLIHLRVVLCISKSTL